MKTLLQKIRKAEFEGRMFISLGVVVAVCLISFLVFPNAPSNMELIGRQFGLPDVLSKRIGFSAVALLMVFASLMRMWAGTVLSSPRVMSFKIQKEVLNTEGPYQLTRHPIYFTDFLCFVSFAFCFPLIGIALPVILYFHYRQLIAYEEENFEKQFGAEYTAYQKHTPIFFPSAKSLVRLGAVLPDFRINQDGFRHNGQYVLLAPGFVVAAITGNFLHAILIGALGVLDWAIVHTKIGMNPHVK